MAGHVAHVGEKCMQFSWENLKERKKPLCRPRRRMEYNIKMNSTEIG
jgi:hypothetical protein